MQNAPATTTVHHHEIDRAVEWAAEAEALAQRVNSRLRRTMATATPVERDEYEPHACERRTPSGRLPRR
jgi:hypothetical protein